MITMSLRLFARSFEGLADRPRQAQCVSFLYTDVCIRCQEACHVHIHTVASLATHTCTVTWRPSGGALSVEAAKELPACSRRLFHRKILRCQTVPWGEQLRITVAAQHANVSNEQVKCCWRAHHAKTIDWVLVEVERGSKIPWVGQAERNVSIARKAIDTFINWNKKHNTSGIRCVDCV